jgi:hypothetical protein
MVAQKSLSGDGRRQQSTAPAMFEPAPSRLVAPSENAMDVPIRDQIVFVLGSGNLL